MLQDQIALLKVKVDEYYRTQSEAALFEVCALLSEAKKSALSDAESEFVNYINVRIPTQF